MTDEIVTQPECLQPRRVSWSPGQGGRGREEDGESAADDQEMDHGQEAEQEDQTFQEFVSK